MTSLVGFEALLREKRVFTYGLPFYAGWGLTQDYVPHARRSRKLKLEELVAGTLLVYPRYYNFRVRAFCTAEQMVSELDRQRRAGGLPRRLPWILRRARYLAVLGREMFKAGQHFGRGP
jgi:capsular polysaccharide export protein